MLPIGQKFYTRTKHRIQQGKKTAGAWLQIGSPFTAEILGRAGFDWLMIDMEHGPGDIMTLIAQLQAMKGYGVDAFVRAPWNDFVTVKRILDAGANGVLIPYVCTKQDAEAAVKAVLYPPRGIRGVAGSPRAEGYGVGNGDYFPYADQEIMLMVAIETQQGVDNLDQILQVEGIDGIFVGPMDLSTSMGHFGDPAHPQVREAIAAIEEKTKAAGKFLGTVAGGYEKARALYDRGYQYIAVMADGVALSNLAHGIVAQFRKEYGD
ncbi:MAG TPA: 2,4-dihydroxyhept-2-ene-1,7-dioic acid aldolase [Candidatus Excrementavichristensenella intestinipullorum]|nr:2,4-dihydroxyhept-2-ene-1,7-dioic acid aldolase [Candidatus Excrementavichristensenella intestinipullorum]